MAYLKSELGPEECVGVFLLFVISFSCAYLYYGHWSAKKIDEWNECVLIHRGKGYTDSQIYGECKQTMAPPSKKLPGFN